MSALLEVDEHGEGVEALVAECRYSDAALRAIVQGILPNAGYAPLRALVALVAAALRVPYAFLTECVDPPPLAPTRVRTLALWVGTDFGADIQYRLSGTPCEDVLREGVCRAYPDRLLELFPSDRYLAALGAASFLGVPVTSASGDVIGHLAVLDRVYMTDIPRKTAILRLFAARASAEMERMEAELTREKRLCAVEAAVARGAALAGLLPMCAWCKAIRDGHGQWTGLEEYIHAHTGADFTHGICPTCLERISATTGD
jgi:hypothetical protein